jgi:hypothetical protein
VALAAHRVIPGAALIERLPIEADELAGLLLTMFALLPAAVSATWAGCTASSTAPTTPAASPQRFSTALPTSSAS